MTLSSCPDVNVWLALASAEHIHHRAAKHWWDEDQSDRILFCRLTQMGLLRLLTTAAVMNQKPLIGAAALAIYDRFLTDDRVRFVAEPSDIEHAFRSLAPIDSASPKLWADAYLAAFAETSGSRLITFDHGLAARASRSLLLARQP